MEGWGILKIFLTKKSGLLERGVEKGNLFKRGLHKGICGRVCRLKISGFTCFKAFVKRFSKFRSSHLRNGRNSRSGESRNFCASACSCKCFSIS